MKCIHCNREAWVIFRGNSLCHKHHKERVEAEKPLTRRGRVLVK